MQLLDDEYRLVDEESEKLDKLIPWPEEAILAYLVFSYTPELDLCLMQLLCDQLGHWWSKDMHRIDRGTSMLPEAFAKQNPSWGKSVEIQKKITFNITVNEVIYEATNHKDPSAWKVTVKSYYTSSGRPFEVEGDAVIITVPLYIIRSIKFVAKENTTAHPQLIKIYQAIEGISQEPSTTIMLQCKIRFWEKEGITGGFTKTNMPIGQIHYPSQESPSRSDRGILKCYTWKGEALSFAAFKPQIAIQEAVRQLEEIHPEIKDQFEVGVVQAWSNEPSS